MIPPSEKIKKICRALYSGGSMTLVRFSCVYARAQRKNGERDEKDVSKMAEGKTKKYKELKADMLANLEARGLVEKVYTDKVNEYMDLWEQRIKLERDIRERGISVLDEKRGMMVENRSISLEVQVSRQMLAIYQALGFKDQALSSKAGAMDDDEL